MRSRAAVAILVLFVGAIVAFALLTRRRGLDSERASLARVTAESTDAGPAPAQLSAAPPPPASRSAELPGPTGQVLEKGSRQPIGGVTVRLTFAGRTLDETTTAADGTFHLSRPERSRRTLEVVGHDWRVSPRSHRLDDSESEGRTPVRFEAERLATARVAGRLLDRRTGEPIPDFLVRVSGPRDEPPAPAGDKEAPDSDRAGEPSIHIEFHPPPRKVEALATDAEGRFLTQGFEAGALELALLDHPDAAKERHVADEDSLQIQHSTELSTPPAEFRIEIGPTYHFGLELPPGTRIEDFEAAFPRAQLGDRELHRLVAQDPRSNMALFYRRAVSPGGLEARAPLRAGDPPWARFRLPILAFPGAEDPRERELVVRSHDGHWAGSAHVDSIEGIQLRILPIELSSRGAIEGSVQGAAGEPVSDAWIELSLAARPPELLRSLGADAGGRFSFLWLEAGEYRVAIQTDRHAESSSIVCVEGGKTVTLEAHLEGTPELGPIHGELRSRTGRHRTFGNAVVLRSLDDPSFFRIQTVRYAPRGGELVAPFTFDQLPAARYELSLLSTDNKPWTAVRLTASPPAEGLEFLCEDDGPAFDLAFRALDARTGEPVASAQSIVWQRAAEELRLDSEWETGIYRGLPESMPLRWILWADGYRLAEGDESVLPTAGELRRVDVRLEPGWGQLFHVTTAERAPLAGAELFLDGESSGTTDAHGLLAVSLGLAPRSLRFELTGWHVSWGNVEPSEEGFACTKETVVYLARDD